MQLLEISIAKYHQGIREGRLTAAELVRFYLERIARFDEKLRSIICVNPHAFEEAEKLDAAWKNSGAWAGPLHAVPVLVKDNIETQGMPTTAGSLSLTGFESNRDAPVVSKLRAAGAIILAKTNLHEFAVWGETTSSMRGQTLNPYDLTRTPGGSSGGTGAALAANFGLAGLGTDTINSVRSPASACNLVGLRPTMGVVSRSGIVPYALTQDTAGPMARSVADLQLLQSVIAGYDPGDLITAWGETLQASEITSRTGLAGWRLGVLRSFFGSEAISEQVNQVMEASLRRLSEADVELVELTDAFDSGRILAEASVHLYELKEDLQAYLQAVNAPVQSLEAILASGKYDPGIGENLQTALGLSKQDPAYAAKLARQKDLRLQLAGLFASLKLDAIVFPHQQMPVCKVGGSQKLRNGVMASVTGFPSLCLPAGFTEPDADAPIGIPVGMELLGSPFSDAKLIRLGAEIEGVLRVRQAPDERNWY